MVDPSSMSLADEQLEDAHVDPRLLRGRGSHAADFWAFAEANDRERLTAQFAIHDMARSAPVAQVTGASEDVARWERAELARAVIASDYAHLNAITLVALLGAVDALVEYTVPDYLKAVGQTPPPRYPRIQGGGSDRWEEYLAVAGLHQPSRHPVPPEMDEALQEFVALRNLIVHRGSRMDGETLAQVPSLSAWLQDGQLVQLRGSHYRTYSAAMRAYGGEIVQRVFMSFGQARTESLLDWREQRVMNA